MKSASMARRQSAALRPRRFDGDRGAQRRSGQAGDGRSRRIDFPGSERRGRPPAGGRGALFFCGRRPYLDVMATQLSPDIVLSPAAAARVRWIAERKAGALPALRLAVDGGGCSGFTYRFGLAESVDADDIVTETDGVKLVVDRKSTRLNSSH